MTVQAIPQVVPSGKVLRRYNDAYRVAATIITLGTFVQAVGLVLALIIGAGGCLFAVNTFRYNFQENQRYAYMAVSVTAAALVYFIFFVVAVLVRAQGQSLRASLDGAVHSSPFLTDTEKASAMRL